MAAVIPAILEKDFLEIEKKIRLVESFVSWVQIDLADNTLIGNSTFTDPAPYVLLKTPLKLELHLMVKNPLSYLDSFIEAGFKRIYAHVEAQNIKEFIEKTDFKNVEVGLAIDGPTPIDKIKPYLPDIDVLLVMAIKAGFSGQKFREDTIAKIKMIREWDFDIPIAVDGAMDLANAKKVVAAGANIINSNSYIFNSPDIKKAIEELKRVV